MSRFGHFRRYGIRSTSIGKLRSEELPGGKIPRQNFVGCLPHLWLQKGAAICNPNLPYFNDRKLKRNGSFHRQLRRLPRQLDNECGAVARTGALSANRAVMEFNESLADRQPETEPSVLPGDVHASLLESVEDP